MATDYRGILFIGDPHLASQVPGFRKDDFPQNGAGFTSVYSGGNFYTSTWRLKTRTNGYFDLRQRYQANAGRVYFHTLRFDGKQYREKPD